jgi:hypothetical protein
MVLRHEALLRQQYLLQELDRIDAELKRRLQIYMIGGGAMALQGIKEATKDVDIIVTDSKEAERLVAVLDGLGYRKVLEPGEEYMKMGASYTGKP